MAREERERRGRLLAREDTRVVNENQLCMGKEVPKKERVKNRNQSGLFGGTCQAALHLSYKAWSGKRKSHVI